jgi:proline iminopeptidase
MQRAFGLAAVLCLGSCGGSADSGGYVAGADGVRLYYRVMGRVGDTVVVVHGGPGLHHRYLVAALAPMTRTHTLLYYDQRGRGRSDTVTDSHAMGVERDVADLEALRRALRLERLTLIGHGWGGAVGVRYAMAHPDRVRRLALISPFFPRASFLWALGVHPYEGPDSAAFEGLSDARRQGRDQRRPRDFCRDYWGVYLSPVPVRDRYATRRLAAAVCDVPDAALARAERVRDLTLRSLGTWDWRGELGAVSAPTLVLQGRGAVWNAAARDWLAGLPDARLVTLDGHPQFPWLDEPGPFVAALDTFLRVTRPLPNRAGE